MRLITIAIMVLAIASTAVAKEPSNWITIKGDREKIKKPSSWVTMEGDNGSILAFDLNEIDEGPPPIKVEVWVDETGTGHYSSESAYFLFDCAGHVKIEYGDPKLSEALTNLAALSELFAPSPTKARLEATICERAGVTIKRDGKPTLRLEDIKKRNGGDPR